MVGILMLLAILGMVAFVVISTIVIYKIINRVLSRAFMHPTAQKAVKKTAKDALKGTIDTINTVTNTGEDDDEGN